MPAPRGHKQTGRSGHFPPDRAVRATVMLDPGEYVRSLYEELVKNMNVSGAEVLREAIRELHRRKSRQWQRAAEQQAQSTAPEELPKAG